MIVFRMRLSTIFAWAAALVLGIGPEAVLAQPLGAPPRAAPTIQVGVAELPTVRSSSEQITDFTEGLMQGLLPAYRVPGLVLVVVKEDHVVVQRGFGNLSDTAQLPIDSFRRLLYAVTAMQMMERGRLTETSPMESGGTVNMALTYQVNNAPELLARTLEKASGQVLPTYIQDRVFVPLGMDASAFTPRGFVTTGADMAKLLQALVNDGMGQAGMLLEPSTLDLMTRTHATPKDGIPGWTYGFAEMRRNGWRALQFDATAPGPGSTFQGRIVWVPEASTAYMIAIDDEPGAPFWRALDDAIFDRMFPSQYEPLPQGPTPSLQDAYEAAGTYLAPTRIRDVVGLMAYPGALKIEARSDGALLLSGAEPGVLLPASGGLWRGTTPQQTGALVNGVFYLGPVPYQRLGFWLRPGFYAALALLMAVAGLFLMLWYRSHHLAKPLALWLGAGFATVGTGSVILAILLFRTILVE